MLEVDSHLLCAGWSFYRVQIRELVYQKLTHGTESQRETKKRSHRAGSERGAHAPFFTKSLALSWIVFASPSVTSSPSSSSAAAPTG